jgi:mono/diheme cytochrome c family protein
LLIAVVACFQAAAGYGQTSDEGKKLYLTYCTGCHGAGGKGNGPAARSLPVKPADHTNGAIMNRHSDEYLLAVISKGGAQVGRSPMMPAWGAVLKENQIKDIIVYIRILGRDLPTATQADVRRSSSRNTK